MTERAQIIFNDEKRRFELCYWVDERPVPPPASKDKAARLYQMSERYTAGITAALFVFAAGGAIGHLVPGAWESWAAFTISLIAAFVVGVAVEYWVSRSNPQLIYPLTVIDNSESPYLLNMLNTTHQEVLTEIGRNIHQESEDRFDGKISEESQKLAEQSISDLYHSIKDTIEDSGMTQANAVAELERIKDRIAGEVDFNKELEQ